MRTRQKQRIVIGVLCAVIIGLTVGYAVLSQQLNINGTGSIISDFSIVFTSIEEINQVPESGDYNDFDNGILGGLNITTHDITTLQADVTNDHQIDLNVDMKKPGATGIYEITVENTGKLDGYISDITGLDEANASEPRDIQFTLYNFKENQKIRVGEEKKFILVVYWSEDATTIPETNKSLTLDLTVTQYSEQEQDRPDIPDPSGKTEYAVGDEVYFDPVKGQRCYSDEAWTLDDKSVTCYKWNVIKASDASSDSVELLLDHDLPGDTAWVNLEDYKAAGGTEEEYGGSGNNKYGPITALKHLKNVTDSWNGVVTLTSTDNVTRQNGSGGNYTIDYNGYKARLISGQEIAAIAGDSDWSPFYASVLNLPTWVYSNMAVNADMEITDVYEHVGYWIDAASGWDLDGAWYVSGAGGMYNGIENVSMTIDGVRPVVRIMKSNI